MKIKDGGAIANLTRRTNIEEIRVKHLRERIFEQGFVRSPNGISFHLDDKYRWQMIGDNDIVPFIKQ